MFDLDVLASQWPGDTAQTEGWTAADLPYLMRSGDLEIHADAFFQAGAADVALQIVRTDTNTALPLRHVTPAAKPEDSYIVVTVPTAPLRVTAAATIDGEPRTSLPLALTLKAGEDQRLDLCATHVTLTPAPPTLPANGLAKSTLTATVQGCPGDTIEDLPVTFAVQRADHQPSGPDRRHGRSRARADQHERRRHDHVHGRHRRADLPDRRHGVTWRTGQTLEARATLQVLPRLKISYIWQQTNLEWHESASTRWPPPKNLAQPDCDDTEVVLPDGTSDSNGPFWGYCVDSFDVALDPGPDPDHPLAVLQRSGVVADAGDHLA